MLAQRNSFTLKTELVLYFFFLSVTWILLTGCNQSTPTAEPEPVAISFSFFLDNDQTNEASYYENLVKQFSSINPHITVDVTPVNRPALLQYSQADVLRLDLAGFQELQESGTISTLDPFIEQDVNFDPSDFFPGSVDAFTDGGQIWAIPAGINTYAMYYNKDVFDKYDVEYPEFDWTWDDFLETASSIRDPKVDVYGYGPSPGYGDSWFFIHQNGGRVFNDWRNPTEVVFDDPLTIEAIEWYADLFLLHDVAPTSEQSIEAFGNPLDTSISRGIESGKFGLWIGEFSDRVGRFRWGFDLPERWGAVPLPHGAQPFSYGYSDVYVISSQTRQPEAAWMWLAFLTEQIPLRRVPARMSVAESELFREQVGNDFADLAFAVLEGAVYPSGWENYADMDGLEFYWQVVDRVIDEKISPSEAMGWAEQETKMGTAPIESSSPVVEENTALWEITSQMKIPHATNVVGFLDEDYGITVGAGGEIHYTTDGGMNWPEATNSSLCRFGLEIVDEQVAWNCGNGGHVRLSTDGGRTWQTVADFGPYEPRHCRFLSFLDAETGWAATPSQLGMTSDSGATWRDVILPEDIQDIAAIELRTADDGYLLDNDGNLFITQNAGQTWTSHSLGLAQRSEFIEFSAPMAAMRFFDAERGLVVISLMSEGSSEILALRTVDGGQSWEQESLPAKFGVPFLARDGSFITITHLGGQITVLRGEGNQG